jgi:hypothetical protein
LDYKGWTYNRMEETTKSGGSYRCKITNKQVEEVVGFINLLTPEFGISILAHTVCKMRIIQGTKKGSIMK